MTVTPKVGRAMAAQLERVNAAGLREDCARLREQNQSLLSEIRLLRQRLGELKANSGTMPMQNGRPVLTVMQAAERAGVSRSTAVRYLNDKHWEGVRVPGSNRWMVYANQPLKPKKDS